MGMLPARHYVSEHTKFIAEELKRDLSDLILHVQNNGYRLQGQLDQITANLDRIRPDSI